jgi:hypothetical protein
VDIQHQSSWYYNAKQKMNTQTIFSETVCLKKLKWRAVFDISIVYTDIMVKAPGLRGANKQASFIDGL